MPEQEIGRPLGGPAKSRELGGEVTADKMAWGTRDRRKRLGRIVCAGLLGTVLAPWPSVNLDGQVTQILPIQPSTVPANGDLNPYGVAFVPAGFPSGGPVQPGDILVSNFNNSTNAQGTGTTIIPIPPTRVKSWNSPILAIFVTQFSIDSATGAAFGIAIATANTGAAENSALAR